MSVSIILHQYDSAVALDLLQMLTGGAVRPEVIPYLLRIDAGRKKRLFKGNRGQPYWPRFSGSKWREHLNADTAGQTPDYNKLTREQDRADYINSKNLADFVPFINSSDFKAPATFDDLFKSLVAYCLELYRMNVSVETDSGKEDEICRERCKKLCEAVTAHAVLNEIDAETVRSIKAFDFTDSRKAAKFLFSLVCASAPEGNEGPRTPAEKPQPLDPLLEEYSRLFDLLYPKNAPRNEASLRKSILAADEMLAFIDEHQWRLCHDLLPTLSKKNRCCPMREELICGETTADRPLLYAIHLLKRVRLYHQFALKFARGSLFHSLLSKAYTDIQTVQCIASDRKVGEHAFLNLTADKDDDRRHDRTARSCEKLLKQSFLSLADHFCLLAERVQSAHMDALIADFMTPAVDALYSAARFCKKNDAEYTRTLSRIMTVFSEKGAALRTSFNAENKAYLEQLDRLQKADKLQTVIPSPSAVPAKEEDYNLFEPIYSGIYDSRAGRDLRNREGIQLSTFELIASGRVVLMQMPQIGDNRCMLELLMNSSGFDRLCSEGIISLSAYGNLIKPTDYILRSLNNPAFRFSCSDYLEAEDEQLRQACRRALHDALLQDTSPTYSPLQLSNVPSEARVELQFLTDALRKTDSVFLQKHTLRYHQSPERRSIPKQWATRPVIPLPDAIDRRIEELEQDDYDYEIIGRAALLETFRAIEQRMRAAGCTTRSDYENLLNVLRKNREFDLTSIRRFRSVIDRSYFLSNGFRTCNTVYTVEEDNMLQLHSRLKPEGFQLSPNAAAVKYVFDEFRSDTPSSRALLDGRDMVHFVREVRSIMRHYGKNGEKTRARLEQELNVGYNLTPTGKVVAGSFNARTDENKVVSISTTQSENSIRKGIEIDG